MKRILLLLSLTACLFAGDRPKVPDCFKIRALIRADADHYWADWTNTCPYTVDSVYVVVGFSDGSRRSLGEGVWSLHFTTPGAHRVTRFTTPSGVSGFEFVDVRRVTTGVEEAFRSQSAY